VQNSPNGLFRSVFFSGSKRSKYAVGSVISSHPRLLSGDCLSVCMKRTDLMPNKQHGRVNLFGLFCNTKRRKNMSRLLRAFQHVSERSQYSVMHSMVQVHYKQATRSRILALRTDYPVSQNSFVPDKVSCPGACYSAAYTCQTRDQKRFTISEVAADWYELSIPQLSMQPFIVRANEQLNPWCSSKTYHCPYQPHQAFTP